MTHQVIREYRPEDLNELLVVWRRAAAVAHPFWSEEELDHEAGEIAEKHMPLAQTFVAICDDAVRGFIALLGNTVGGIFVDPEWQGEGLGLALMDHARSLHPAMDLEVFEVNQKARKFYRAYGFSETSRRLDPVTGQGVVSMRLEPPPKGAI